MKIVFSKKDKQRLHSQYRQGLMHAMSVINKFHPVIVWNPSYPFHTISFIKRSNDKREPPDE